MKLRDDPKGTATLLTRPVNPENSDLTQLSKASADFIVNIENATPTECDNALEIAQNIVDAIKAKMIDEEIIEEQSSEESIQEEAETVVEPALSITEKYLGKHK